jgi:hypothetical protein
MIIPKTLGLLSDFGGEVTVKRPSPLPLKPGCGINKTGKYYK